jgi:hypothetical protein
MSEMRNAYKIMDGKLEGKGQLERPGRRWEDGIKINIRETVWGSVGWIHVVQDQIR